MTAGIIVGAIVLLWPAWTNLAAADDVPEEYVVDYPDAEQFCPPIRRYFESAASTVERVRGRTIRHARNGGFGLPVRDKVGKRHLLHLGADVGWFQVGEPVFAIANGVVRLSEGPPMDDEATTGAARRHGVQRAGLAWGNIVAIEHRLPSGDFITSVYGHLASKRLVKVGDVVTAGQQIGSIGRKHASVNGGYDPHLHFAIRKGRKAEEGAVSVNVSFEGSKVPLKIARVGANYVELAAADKLPGAVLVGDRRYPLESQDGAVVIDSDILWHIQPPSFRIVGYGLSAETWHDPTAFLKQQGARAGLLKPARQ